MSVQETNLTYAGWSAEPLSLGRSLVSSSHGLLGVFEGFFGLVSSLQPSTPYSKNEKIFRGSTYSYNRLFFMRSLIVEIEVTVMDGKLYYDGSDSQDKRSSGHYLLHHSS